MALASRGMLRTPIRCCLIALAIGCSTSSIGTLGLKNAPRGLLGVAPQDEEYFAAEFIACRDGSKFFRRGRLNDGFCDCPDGTDEPGTSACPEGRFYCRNTGEKPKILFSSRVNDRICDCCDGSDEYDGSTACPDVCSKDEDSAESKRRVNPDDLIMKPKELRLAVLVEVFLSICGIAFCLIRLRDMSKRRRRRQRS